MAIKQNTGIYTPGHSPEAEATVYAVRPQALPEHSTEVHASVSGPTDQPAYTPGPWTFHTYHGSAADVAKMRELGMSPVQALTNDGQRFIMTTGEEPTRIALVDTQTKFKRGQGHQVECEERDANARLIAAAPELVGALRNMLAVVGSLPKSAYLSILDEDINKARSLLARVEAK